MGITPLRAEVADRLASAGLTYREAGATAGDLPSGYRHVSHRVLIGRGPEVLASAGEAVFQVGTGRHEFSGPDLRPAGSTGCIVS